MRCDVGQALQAVDSDRELRVRWAGGGTIEGLPPEGIGSGHEGVDDLRHSHGG
ncbi:hypothetical protein IAI33_11385, partial [Streptococcus pseudopneumoniae]|nr:hypothetical protein [Streptococcus pseudopneumoniae]